MACRKPRRRYAPRAGQAQAQARAQVRARAYGGRDLLDRATAPPSAAREAASAATAATAVAAASAAALLDVLSTTALFSVAAAD